MAGRLVHAIDPDVIVEAASRRLEKEIESSYAYLNPYAAVDISRANLPHWRQDAVTYFVTFRLADSLPFEKLKAWKRERNIWLEKHPKPWEEEEQKEYYNRFPRQLEQWLDNGSGSCILKSPDIKELVENALRYFDRKRYQLGKFVVASNHVHVIVTPIPGNDLSNILHSWKSYSAKEILKVEAASRRLERKEAWQDAATTEVEAASRRLKKKEAWQHAATTDVGLASRLLTELQGEYKSGSAIWQKEYYDHILRSPEELYNIELYIQRHAEYERIDFTELLQRQDAAATECYRAAAEEVKREAAKPLYDPRLRELLVDLKRKNEQTIDTVSADTVIEAGFSVDAADRAKILVESFEKFIEDNKDEITALQVLYSGPYRARLHYEDIKALAEAIQEPPRLWRVENIWKAYEALEKSKVKGASAQHIMTDIVSLVRFALHQADELVPYPDLVEENFKAWLEQQKVEAASRRSEKINQRQDAAATVSVPFTEEQMKWLRMIKDHIAGSLSIEADDFEYSPFAQEGGLGRAYQLFGEQLSPILQQLNEGLVA